MALALLATCHAFSGIKFDQRFSRDIRRADFYEAIAGSKVHFILYYEETDALTYSFVPGWNRLAEDYKDNEDVVFLQVRCAADKGPVSGGSVLGELLYGPPSLQAAGR